MNRAAVIIPNLNGMTYLPACLNALEKQSVRDFTTVMVDNGSTDGSVSYVEAHYPWVRIYRFETNTGFAGAVNQGIRMTDEPYVILLNNDTRVGRHFVEELIRAMEKDPRCFSCNARMLSMGDPSKLDDAGDLYCALGWAYARGKGHSADAPAYTRRTQIFASCGGAAIYRRSILDEIGLFDERFFAYLEDIDLGYRARAAGYRSYFAPGALVMHHGSASSGSRYNAFKVSLTARNSIWLIHKNMPAWQIALNAPCLFTGYLVKTIFFLRKGLAGEYLRGIRRALRTLPDKQIYTGQGCTKNYLRIQLELWVNTIRRIEG